MRIQVEKFLAVTAMLASVAAIGVGCSSESTDTNNKPGGGGSGAKGGTAGKDGSTGGTSGAAGTSQGGTAGGGGAAGGGGVAGGGGAAGAGGGTCLGDGDPDAGTEGIDCTTLSYYGTLCGADPDAGTEGTAPLGAQFCDYMAASGRADVNAELLTCLSAITGDACSAAHDTAVQNCYDTVAAKACQHSPFPDGDGGTYDPCKDITAGQDPCSAITEAQCNAALNPLNTDKVIAVLDCYSAGTGECSADFEACIGLP